VALEQAGFQTRLQLRDLPTDRALAQVEQLTGLAEVADSCFYALLTWD
jgi:hypothetical protein